MTTGIPILDFVDAIATALAPVAPSAYDPKSLDNRAKPPRFVWVYDNVRTVASSHAVFDDIWVLSVHCWGRTKAEAFRLRQGLLTAAREAAGGQTVEVVQTTFKGGDAQLEQGFVCVVELHITLPLYEAAIVDGEIIDAIGTTAQATDYQFDPSESEAGDGQLNAGEG